MTLLDWYVRLLEATDADRSLREWVVPRLEPEVWLEDLDARGPSSWWRKVITGRQADQLCDVVAACKARCTDSGADFAHVLENVRHSTDSAGAQQGRPAAAATATSASPACVNRARRPR